jgi:hypothetical protein
LKSTGGFQFLLPASPGNPHLSVIPYVHYF